MGIVPDSEDVAKAASGLADLAKEVPVYKDGSQPAVRELGDSLETVAKLVRVAITPVSVVVWGYEKIVEYIEPAIAKRLSKTPGDNMGTPSALVAGPALEALRYAGPQPLLRDMYANLLANSIDKTTATMAHPSFVEVIKNLSSDEAKILTHLITVDDAVAMIEVRLTTKATEAFDVLHHSFSHVGVAVGCEHKELVPSYINNLARLGLIEVPESTFLAKKGSYSDLEKDPYVKQLEVDQNSKTHHITLQQKAARLTDYGRQFCRACVVERVG